jgi:uncharacterized repeat protein (TIGR03803 family)
MRSTNFSVGLTTLALMALAVIGMARSSLAQTETILHNFGNNGTDGVNPRGGLIFDKAGNLYGTTMEGGPGSAGIVFELTPITGGGWKEVLLHAFGHGKDGQVPVAGLIFDAADNLYGTTAAGGTYNAGTVFELSPQASGGWKETILHSFNPARKDGVGPGCPLVFDSVGNLYGTTDGGGAYGTSVNGGTVFELSPQPNGSWTETILHNFNPNTTDGSLPDWGGVIFDALGNLYGATYGGGAYTCGSYGCGTVFELTPKAGGGWAERILHNFQNNGSDGYGPGTGVILDHAGNLFGTTSWGGAYGESFGGGVVFELTRKAGGSWAESILHSFNTLSGTDGIFPLSVTMDTSGNLYGTTTSGDFIANGMVYELTPTTGGAWTEQILYWFSENGTDGYEPQTGVILNSAGNIYGTTYSGGTHAYSGTVYEITP